MKDSSASTPGLILLWLGSLCFLTAALLLCPSLARPHFILDHYNDFNIGAFQLQWVDLYGIGDSPSYNIDNQCDWSFLGATYNLFGDQHAQQHSDCNTFIHFRQLLCVALGSYIVISFIMLAYALKQSIRPSSLPSLPLCVIIFGLLACLPVGSNVAAFALITQLSNNGSFGLDYSFGDSYDLCVAAFPVGVVGVLVFSGAAMWVSKSCKLKEPVSPSPATVVELAKPSLNVTIPEEAV